MDKFRRILILCSHTVDPRMRKRVTTLSKLSDNFLLVYWKRDHGHGYGQGFAADKSKVRELKASAKPNYFTRFLENLILFVKSKRLIEEFKPDLIYISGIEALAAIGNIHQKLGATVVLEISDIPGNHFVTKHKIVGSFVERIMNRLILKKADYVVFTSLGFYERYYKNRGLMEHKFFVFENVPEKRIFKVCNTSTNTEKIKNEIVIGYIGSMEYIHIQPLKTLFRACQNISGVKVLVAGKGPAFDEINAEAEKYENVVVHGPYNYERDIVQLYSSVDVVYSVYDTSIFNVRVALPNKLYEAIVCGKPIIVARETYLEEYVKKLGVGFSIKYDSVKEHEEVVRQIKENPTVLEEIRRRELDIAERYFYENVEKEFLSWLKEISKNNVT
ncbi:MAG: glycosyltransferase [Fervidobacterium sp.]|uniref:glycosyltransferase n=1 Tax=Fervidobacterium sp. TaxID=1871331 RepID=UPI00404A492E